MVRGVGALRRRRQPYWMMNEGEDDGGLGGFKFKKIFKVAKFAFPVLLVPDALKKGGKLLKKVGQGAGKVLKGMGAMFKPKGGGAGDYSVPAPGGYDDPMGAGGGPGGPEGSEGGMLGGMSPLTLGLLVGAPVVLMLLMKKK